MKEEYSISNLRWIIVAVVLSLGLIVSTWIFTGGLVAYKATSKTIAVTGSAKRAIQSDWVVWSGTYSYQAARLIDAYKKLDESRGKVRQYFIGKGVAEKDLIFSPVYTNVNKQVLPNGQMSNVIESYQLSQNVEIRSGAVQKITELSRMATELIDQGVEFQSNPPRYFYTKIADLKIEMLTLATKDAFTRAQQIAANAHSHVAALAAAQQGVFQITPMYSNDVSDSGINDTSSLEKEITAVVNCSFTIKK